MPSVAAARALLQRAVHVHAARLQSGRETDQDAARERHRDRERCNAQIQARRHEARKCHRALRNQHRHRRAREEQADRRADQRQHAAFRDQLAQQPRAAGAERRAHRDLAAPRLRPRDQQIGDVRARDQQHERDRRHQRQQDRPQRADQLDVERTHLDAALFVRLRILAFELARDAVELALRRVHRDAGLQPRQRRESPSAALGHRGRRRIHRERHPELRRVAQTLEAGRHDADHGVLPRRAAERERAPEDLRIGAESALPQTVAQNDHVRRLGHEVLVGLKHAAARRRHAQQRKVRRRDEFSVDALGLLGPDHRHALAVEGGDVLEALRSRAPIDVVRIRGPPAFHSRAHDIAPQFHERGRILVRERPLADRVDEAEDGRVRADADRERQHRDDREARRFAERPQRVAHILRQRLERRERPHVAALLLQIRHVAEPAARGGAGIGRRRAVAAILRLAHRQVKRELVVQIALELPAVNERS